MRRLRWQILVVTVTMVVVGILLVSQQPIGPVITLPEPATGGVYTEGLVGAMGRLNPLLDWNNPADRDVNRLLFSGLIRFDARGLPQGDLAESWGVTPDGTIYNFTLRPSATWHDGRPVTTADVAFTIEMLQSAGSLAPQDIKDLWSQIEFNELDEKNFQLVLPEPFAPFLDYTTFGILPRHLLETVAPDQLASAEFNLQPVGTGPYKFDHLLVDGGQITGVVLTLNDAYHLQKPFIPQIVFRYYPSAAGAMDAYRQGEVLGISQLSPDVLPDALAEQDLSVYTSRLPQMTIVFLNLNNSSVPFLQNEKVRRALMLGLNRSAIVARVLYGQAIVADGPILPGSWAHYDGIEHLEYDPEAAAALLKAEGYAIPAGGGEVRVKDGQPLSLTLVHPDDPLHTQIAQAIQADWAQIGVQTNLLNLPYAQLVSEQLAPRIYHAALADVNTARTPDPDPYPFWHQAEATGGQNYSQWDNRTASEYLETARTLTDFSDRTRLYRNFQVMFAKELPSLPLFYPVYSYGVDAQVQGVQVAPLYDTSDRLAFISEWFLVTRRTLEQTPQPTIGP
jgi:peptide/nickel transport system substrate-binding protein